MHFDNLLQTSPEQPILAGESNLEFIFNKLTKHLGVIIFYVESGIAQISINFKEYTISQYSQVAVMPSSTLMLLYASADFRIKYVSFERDILIGLGSQIDHSLFTFIRNNPHYNHPAERYPVVRRTFDCMVDIYNDRDNRFRIQIMSNLVLNFFMDCYDKVHRYLEGNEIEASSRQEELFRHFIQLIHQYIHSEREVIFYAGMLNITPRYLSTITRQVAHKSAKEIIDDHIVVEIKILLQSTSLSIQEISNRLNFPDQSFLGKYFKKHTGLSPIMYRRQG